MDAFITRRGGGGASLNFTVVGGTAQPDAPKENTIWVDTQTEISGWAFSADEPDNPAAGMVWFPVNIPSMAEFNAVKENTVRVYPLSAKQYADGAWIDVPAKIYQNQQWTDLISTVYLYKRGNEYENLTGGWGITWQSGGTTSLTRNSDSFYMKSTGSSGSGGNFTASTARKINISPDHTKLCARVKHTVSSGTAFRFGLNTANVATIASSPFYRSLESSYDGVVELDVSAASGLYYVLIGLTGTKTSNSGNCYVYEVYLE